MVATQTGNCHAHTHMHAIEAIITQNACYGVRFIVLVTFVVYNDRHLVYQIGCDAVCDSKGIRFGLNSQKVEWNRQNVGEDVYVLCECRRTDIFIYTCTCTCVRAFSLCTMGETKAIGPCSFGQLRYICLSVYLSICLSAYLSATTASGMFHSQKHIFLFR